MITTCDARDRAARHEARRNWGEVLLRLWSGMTEKNLSLVAAGTAFFAFLAIPSGLTALVAFYGLVADPGDVQRSIDATQAVLPHEAVVLLSDQANNLMSHSPESLGIGLMVSVLVTLWSATSSTTSMMNALNIAYQENEKRGLLRYYATALLLTVAGAAIGVLALAVITGLPAALGILPLGRAAKVIAWIAPWPILVALIMPALAVIYRYAPSRAEMPCRWISWGSAMATALWIAASVLFSVYVGQFASYDRTYGSLGAVVVLQMWLYLSAFVVLLGAQLNAEIERPTAAAGRDGSEERLGRGGAAVAEGWQRGG